MYTEFLLQALSLIGGLAFFLYGMNVMGDKIIRGKIRANIRKVDG